MPALLIYLIKANIALTLFYLAYRWGLRRLTFYTLNRFFLLTGIACASVFPLIDVNALLQRHREIGTVVEYVPDLRLLQAQPAAEFSVWHLLVYVFWAGVAVMGIRFAVQLLSLWRLHRQSHAAVIRRLPVKVLDRPLNPFSFFSNIYVNPSLHQPAELDAILQHEQVHVRQWHTIDVLAAELNNIFYWFNPGAWLMRTAVRENLEFITDRRMLQQGVDPKTYQYNLIKVSGIPYATAIANNFNFSHLKNRIKMMNSKRSAKYNVLRYVVLGSIVAVALLSLNFSRAAFHGKDSAPAADTIPPPSPASLVTPAAPAPPPAMTDSMPPAPPAPTVVRVSPSAPAVPASPVASLPVLPPEPTVIPVAPPRPAAPPAPAAPPLPDTVPAGLLMQKSDAPPLFIVDGIKKGRAAPAGLKGEDIANINVWKGESAQAIYGEEGRDGVIVITTKQQVALEPRVVVGNKIKVKLTDSVKVRTVISKRLDPEVNVTDASHHPKVVTLRNLDSTKNPVIVINGKVKSLKALQAIPKDQIQTINVYKGEPGTFKYGKKAEGGVVEVHTKDTFNYK
ncbi:M56 family metallopeptidase [Chitinophaga japonensis]|uniref:TonB-dependent SusC/RagA subfamily outer membrane receptor n=1 Tax=Chitinophaga japonensis TaxID=104662 RepID=A0A562T462_CHIJA|nr:M56 family metallopeptidase [Chitinophaga japonensis]TWI88331.1 TonB-dependent SusC/RagA subfamily outer membrane receptor [Chitinophaga japonensis]